jgi:hypothetical protein
MLQHWMTRAGISGIGSAAYTDRWERCTQQFESATTVIGSVVTWDEFRPDERLGRNRSWKRVSQAQCQRDQGKSRVRITAGGKYSAAGNVKIFYRMNATILIDADSRAIGTLRW